MDIGADGQPVDELKAALTALYKDRVAGKDTVLVCEDHPGVRALLDRALPKVLSSGGLTKVVSFDGPTGAVETLRQQGSRDAIAVVFSDNDMPLTDQGLALVQQLRGELGVNDVPFVLASGRANKFTPGVTGLGPEADRLFSSGVIDMVVGKPFGRNDLRQIMVSAIQRRVGLLKDGSVDPVNVFVREESRSNL